jgi:hypothetical protein
MGKGLFAKRDIKRGDLIFAERPLLVSPNKMVMILPDAISDPQQKMRETLLQVERTLEFAIGRLPPESQADYKALQNVRTDGSGPLYGVMMTNSYSMTNYTMVLTRIKFTVLFAKLGLALITGILLRLALNQTRLTLSKLHPKYKA